MKRIGLIVKASNPQALRLGCSIAGWAAERGVEVYVADDERSGGGVIRPAKAVSAGTLADSVDVMAVLGGDGTMLSAARLINGRKVPIIGVNLGGLGFLTALTALDDVYPVLERIIKGDYKAEERMMLAVEHSRGAEVLNRYRVLNDAVIRGGAARLVRMETRINREYVTTYRADGLIIATPTGSTAYSLSAAGPILYPTIHSIIVAPICPFNLTNRPVVIPDWMTVEVRVTPEQANIQLVLDGQVDVPIASGDMISVRRDEASAYLIKYEGKSYFDILRERLMWEVKIEKG